MRENQILKDILIEILTENGYKAEEHTEYLAVVVEKELEIAFDIIPDPNLHPNVMKLLMVAIHQTYFPDGIEEIIAGFGENLQEKIEAALNNYFITTFTPIIDSFQTLHSPDLELYTDKIHWHTSLGEIYGQGKWEKLPNNEVFFDLLKEKLPEKLHSNQKYHWLKLYVAKINGEKFIDCRFDNEDWEEGIEILSDYADEKWEEKGIGLKQFIMFRQCDNLHE